MSKKEYLKHWRRNQAELQNLFEEEIPALVSSPEASDFEGEQMKVKIANVSCEDSFSETSELEKTVYDDLEELSSVFESTVEHLMDSDNDLDEERKMEIDIEENGENILSDIAEWASRNLITHTALRELLVILKNHGHPSLPRDPRTLLRIPRIIGSTQKCGGDYVYLGLRSVISNFLSNPANNCDILELIVNIDGLPLFKSASTQLWPILAKVNLGKPSVVALFCGKSKPDSIEEYLSDFLVEYKQITEKGFAWDDKIYFVKIKALVCDAPARQFVKCIKGHSGYYSCERCEIQGNWEQGMYFIETDSAIREDSKFSSFEYEDHQIQRSPLIDYGISCVKQFPLDYMHLVCLGVMKRMLLFMKEGPLQSAARLSQKQVKEISFKLENLTGTLPSEFARQPRSLEELKRWKATEFKQFLLYTGPVVLEGVIDDNIYIHFLAFSVAISIFLNKHKIKDSTNISYAKDLPEFYGKKFLVYNVHNLIHLHQDVEYFGETLDAYSCFPFENHLQVLKRYVRSSRNPISQIVKKISIMDIFKTGSSCKQSICTVSTSLKDSWFIHESGHYVKVTDIGEEGVLCKMYKKHLAENFYEKPCKSKFLGIVYFRRNASFTNIFSVKDKLHTKLIFIPYKEGFLLIPLLHC